MRGEVLLHGLKQDDPIRIDDIDSPYASIPSLRDSIYARGLDPTTDSCVSGNSPLVMRSRDGGGARTA